MEINTSHQLEIHCKEMSESGAEDGEVKQELETHPELLLGLALENSQSLHLQRTWCHSCPPEEPWSWDSRAVRRSCAGAQPLYRL